MFLHVTPRLPAVYMLTELRYSGVTNTPQFGRLIHCRVQRFVRLILFLAKTNTSASYVGEQLLQPVLFFLLFYIGK